MSMARIHPPTYMKQANDALQAVDVLVKQARKSSSGRGK